MKSLEREMYDLCKELFPINRSLTGDGVRETLGIIKSHLPELKIFFTTIRSSGASTVHLSADKSSELFK